VIITEDSDLMAFGAKRMLYKLDFGTMIGSELDLDEVPSSREANFTWFTHCMFLTTCILSGCDYLNQVNGVGLKTAQKFIGRVTTFRGFLGELGNKVNDVPSDYELNFMKAFLTFRFQRVYCPVRRACVELNDFSYLSRNLEEMREDEKAGKHWSEEVLNYEVMEYVQLNNLDF
jgi:exonuclease-1